MGAERATLIDAIDSFDVLQYSIPYSLEIAPQSISGSNNHKVNIHLDSLTRQFQTGVVPSYSYHPLNPLFMTAGPSRIPPGT